MQGMTFITMMVARLAGPNGSNLNSGGGGTDADITLDLVVYGYFFITIVQILGILANDRSPIQVNKWYGMFFRKYTLQLQNTLFALCGFCLYISIGSKIASWVHDSMAKHPDHAGLASMCILTSFVYLIDLVFCLKTLKDS